MISRRVGGLAACLLLLGASLSHASGIYLPHADGGALRLPAQAERIVTLAPNLTEMVFAAGAGDRLVGVVEYSNFPTEAQQLPRVGDAFRIDLERVITLKPDLVIAWKSGNPQAAVKKLEDLGLKVWRTEMSRLDEIADMLEHIALATGNSGYGQAMAKDFRNRLVRMRHDHADKSAVRYFFQISARPLYTISGDHIISRGLEICGGRNVFSELPTLAPQVTRESVIQANPHALISTTISDEAPSLDVWLEWPHLQAVKNDHLFYLPADEVSQATPRLLDSIDLACKLMDDVRTTTQSTE
jgi:iron complex transport system substrate-binding protein